MALTAVVWSERPAAVLRLTLFIIHEIAGGVFFFQRYETQGFTTETNSMKDQHIIAVFKKKKIRKVLPRRKKAISNY